VKKMVLVASGSIASAMGVERGPSEGQRAMRRFDEEPTRENMRAVLEGLVCNQAAITDELIDGRFERATSPGRARRSNRSASKAFFFAAPELVGSRGPTVVTATD
jgi:hypothetical protein